MHFTETWQARCVCFADVCHCLHSDTTASTLTNIFLELAKQPDLMISLRGELQAAIGSSGEITNKALQSLNLLNGVLSETLRLHPPAGLLQRKTPPEGITIDGTYIPGEMTVWCPQYVVGRSKRSPPCRMVNIEADLTCDR